MEHSANIANIAKALVQARPSIAKIVKTSTAKINSTKGAYSYKYADLGDALDAVLPALQENGVLLMQSAESTEQHPVMIVTMLVHAESGEWFRSELAMKPNALDPQSVGSAITYGRRYALLPMLGLAAEDDDGGAASARVIQPPLAVETAPSAPADVPAPKKKIGLDIRAKFNGVTAKLPEPEIEATIKEVQKHYGSTQTGLVEDLHEGDEARDAYKFLDRKAKEFAA